jgi:hypothetical protein
MLIRSSWAKLRIQEVDTKYAERIGESKLSTFSDGLRHLRQIILLSPETAATVPGVLATIAAVMLWVFAAQSSYGFGQAGSLSWVADVAAGVLSILGPLLLCTGIVLKYRAESSGLRSAHVKLPLANLIRRFSLYGLLLVFISLATLVVLLINFYHQPEFISKSVAASLASFVRSAFVVGLVLCAAPIIAPFLITSPHSRLPIPAEEHMNAAQLFGTDFEQEEESAEPCIVCEQQSALREA